MVISKQTMDAMKGLATAMIREPDPTSLAGEDMTRGFRQGRIPAALLEAAGEDNLIITGEHRRLYGQVLMRLGREREMEHMSTRDIDEELWDLICELFVRRRRYRDGRHRVRRIRAFLSQLQRPWQDYEVISAIDHVSLTVRELDMAGVKFRRLSRASSWVRDIQEETRGHPMYQDFAGRTVGLVSTTAGSARRAAEKAVEAIDYALHALRAGLVGSIKANIPDESLLFRRGTALAVKALGTGKVELLEWHWPFQPLPFEVRRHTAKPVEKHTRIVNELVQRAPQEVRARLLRALHWIGMSITREIHDDKVVDLCTALETLLTLRSDPRKGDALALRSMLLPIALGQGFFDPAPLYELYDLRSNIIHGSELRVASARHYSHLLWIATIMVSCFAQLGTNRPDITDLSKLIDAIETPEALSRAIEWLEASRRPVDRTIADFARERLNSIG